jgi:hypothetical protein
MLLQNFFDAHGATITKKENLLHISMRAQSWRELVSKENASLFPINGNRFKSSILDNDEDFRGGSLAQFEEETLGNINLEPYQSAMDSLLEGPLAEKLLSLKDAINSDLDFCFSDCEGEFDFSRRFEERPFIMYRQDKREDKIIEIRCNLTFASGVSAAHIQKFGAFIWAICQIIESAGKQARIVGVYKSHEIINNSIATEIEAIIKESDEYITPVFLASCLSTGFVRRALFAGLISAAELLADSVHYGLGRCEFSKTKIDYDNGVLSVSGDAWHGLTFEALETLERALLA